jgi:hypothetical protein
MNVNRLNRWRIGGVAAVLTSALLAALLITESALPAREEVKPAALPSDLAKVPSDGLFFLSVRIADLWESKLGEPVRRKLAKEIGEPAEAFEKFFGLPLQQVERLTMVALDPIGGGEPLLFLHGTKAYDRAKVLAAHKNVQERKYKDQTFYSDDKDWAVYPLDDRSLVYGHPKSIEGLIDHPAPKAAGNLAGSLKVAAGKHSLTVGFNVKNFNDAVGERLPGEVEPFKPLLEALSGMLTVDVAEESRVVANLTFPDEKKAMAGMKPLKSGLDLAVAGLDQTMAQMAREQGMDKFIELTKKVQAAVKTAKIEQQGTVLQASAGLTVDVSTVGVVFLEAVQKTRTAASRSQTANNFKQIALAMHNYHDTYGRLPARASAYDKNGKPMLSWRVLILPFVEQQDLYKEFHLDEPWDSEHNKKLLAKMPKLYASPHDENTLKDHTTYYQVFAGKGCMFEGKQGIRFADVTDGLSNTILAAEAAKAVPWTKPDDLPYDPEKPLPKLGMPGAKGFQAAMGDGSVHFISEKITEKTLRNAITRNDGNPLGPDF